MPAKKKQNNKSKKPVAKRLNVPEVTWAAQNGAQRDETIKEIKTKFGALDLKSVEILEATEVQFPKGIAVEQLAAVGCCTEAQGKELAKFENLMEVFDKFEVEVASVCVGVKMPFLVNAFDLEGKSHPILEDRRGKLVFIQFWCPWNDRCQKAVARVAELVKSKGAEWAGKVCFLTVACDTTLEKLSAKLKEKEWAELPHVTHLWAGDTKEDEEEDAEDSDNILAKYEINDLPEFMLIDGEGKLAKRGDLEEFDPETYITKKLAGDKSCDEADQIVTANTFQALTQDERKALLDKACEVLKSDACFEEFFLVVNQAKIHPIGINKVYEDTAILLAGSVEVQYEKRVAEVLKIIKDAGVEDLEQSISVTGPAGRLVPTEACYLCKTNFTPEDVRWHCALCVNPAVTMCTACINKDSKAPKEERSDHPTYHAWFRIGPASTQEDIDAMDMGMGRFEVTMVDEDEKKFLGPQEGENKSEVVHDGVYCNGCKEKGPISNMPRWKCCSCADFDFCDECMNKHIANAPAVKKPKSKKGGKGKEVKEFEPHDQKHIFLRIDDSELVRPTSEEDEGDEGDMDFDEGDLEMMTKAMQGIEGGYGLDDDTEKLTMRIREMSANGELDSEEDDAHPNEMLNQLAEEASQVPLPEDDEDVD